MIGCRLSVVSCLAVVLMACGRTAAPPPPPTAPSPAPVVAPEPLAQNFDEAKLLLAGGQLELYEHSLQALAASTDPQTSHRAMALLALFYVDQKRTEDAIPALTRAADAYKEVAPWLRLRLTELQSGAAHYSDSIATANQIVQEAPATSAATVARLRLPALYAVAADPGGTENSLKEAATVPIDELTEEEFVNLATRLEKAGRQDLATTVRMQLLTQYPQGRFTEQTYTLVQKGPPSPLDTLPIDDALALARKLGGENHYDEALDLLGRIALRSPDAAISAEYRSVHLRSLFNSRHYEEVLNETADLKLDDPALILLRARAAWRADEPKIFLAGLKRIERKYPKSSQAVEAKLLRAKYYTVDDPRPQRAIENLEKGIKAGGVGTEGENLWSLGWTYVLAKRYGDALRIFDRYGREFPDGDYMTNALFWSAKIHERLGHLDQRDAAFNALLASYPYSYYSYRAREIMQQPAAAPTEIPNGNAFPNIDADIAVLNEPRLDSVRELAWLALYREATAEMKAIAAAYPTSSGMAFKLADLYSVAGEPFKAVNVLQRRFRPFVRHGGSGVPHRFWEMLFPLKYWESIRTEAQRRQIDPYLIASIIRQESGFEPSTVSNAGAVGIMQIMPQEAERIAGHCHTGDCGLQCWRRGSWQMDCSNAGQ